MPTHCVKIAEESVRNLKQQLLSLDLHRTVFDVFTLVWLQNVGEGATYYADLIHEKLKAAGYYDEIGQFDVTEEVGLSIYDLAAEFSNNPKDSCFLGCSQVALI